MRVIKVHLHGILAEEYGGGHEFALSYHGDIVRAFTANYPSFKRRILELHNQGFVYRLVSGPLIGGEDLGEENLLETVRSPELHLVPVIAGSGGVFRFIGGVALVGAGFLLGGFAGGFVAKALIGVGASLALNGLNQILAPRPQTPSFESQEENTIFGAGNGVSPFRFAVPLVYGHFRVKQPAILSSGTYSFADKSSKMMMATTEYSTAGYTVLQFSDFDDTGTSVTPNSYPVFRLTGTLKNETDYSTLVALSEGEIEGLALASIQQSIFLDDTPLQDSEGADNFGEVYVTSTTGTATQELSLPSVNATLTETAVGVELEDGVAVTRSFSGDYFRVWAKIQINQLVDLDSDDGDIKAEPLDILFEIDTDSKGYITVAKFDIDAKTQKPFATTVPIDLPESTSQTWNLKVTATYVSGTQAEDEEVTVSVAWASYTTLEKLTDNLSNTAVLGLELDADFLGSAPVVSAELKGIKVQVPHNYNPATRTYTGAFNGTLSATRQYSNNPVWCLYDVLTTARYGIGLSADDIDIYSFYAASVYCDENVNDGQGGLEPRYTFNASIVERVDAQELVRAIASSFNAFPVWSGGKLGLVQDKPADPVWAFSPANVVVDVGSDGVESPPFDYSQVDESARYSAANIAYIDPDNNWEQEVEEVEDSTLISANGYKPVETAAFGCTSRGQARRMGRWEIFTSSYNDEFVSFQAARDFLPIEVGDVIEIFDKYEQGTRQAGRIASAASTTVVTLDAEPNLGAGTDELTLFFADGTQETKDLASTSGAEVTVSSAFSQTPTRGTLYAVRRTDVEPTLWRVVSISEADDEIFDVQAARYLDSKWAYVEDGSLLPSPNNSLSSLAPDAPANLTLTTWDALDGSGSNLIVVGILEWTQPSSPASSVSYEVRYKRNGATEWVSQKVKSTTLDLTLQYDTYEFQVRAVSPIGVTSNWASLEQSIVASANPPANVQNFSLDSRITNVAALSWSPATDADVRFGGVMRIRFSPSGAGWGTALKLGDFPGTSTSGTVALLEGTYYAKWVDPFGIGSETAAEIVTSDIGFFDRNVIATITEDPSFAGTKTNCEVDGSGYLTITDPTAQAIYTFDNSLTVTDLQDAQLIADYRLFPTGELFDDATGNFDDRAGLFDGSADGVVDIRMQVRTSADGVTFGGWEDFTVATKNLLEAEFRLILESDGEANVQVQDLAVVADVQDRREAGTVTTSDSATTTVTFSKPYVQAPDGIVYSIQSGTTEDEVTISNITTDGFDIDVYQSSSRIARSIKWETESY